MRIPWWPCARIYEDLGIVEGYLYRGRYTVVALKEDLTSSSSSSSCDPGANVDSDTSLTVINAQVSHSQHDTNVDKLVVQGQNVNKILAVSNENVNIGMLLKAKIKERVRPADLFRRVFF